MIDNNIETNTVSCENENNNGEVKSHHSGSHHSSSHHSSSHHSSSHHSGSHHSSSRHSSSHHSGSHHSSSRHSRSQQKSTSGNGFSLARFLEKTSTSRTSASVPQYRKVSQRVLFCLIFFGFIILAIIGIVSPTDTSITPETAKTRSEADQLRAQITLLQQEKAELERQLNVYINLYGELDEAKPEN